MKELDLKYYGELLNFEHTDKEVFIDLVVSDGVSFSRSNKTVISTNESLFKLKKGVDILEIVCDDLDRTFKNMYREKYDNIYHPIKFITIEDTDRIIEFAFKNRNKNIIIVCNYSPKMANTLFTFLHEKVLLNHNDLYRSDPEIINSYFLKLLKKSYKKFVKNNKDEIKKYKEENKQK